MSPDQVMGRHCGYLALVAGIVSEADFILIPEWPPEANWPDKMCQKVWYINNVAGVWCVKSFNVTRIVCKDV